MTEYLAKVNALHDKLENLTRDIMTLQESLEYVQATTSGEEKTYMSKLLDGILYTLMKQTGRIAEDSLAAETLAGELAR